MDPFERLEPLSKREVLDGLGEVLAANRQSMAELVALLTEVEERRLHLDAACSSMFDYCVSRLGFSEDEACRRIEAARLARRFPKLLPWLASGDVSLTVLALLKPYLTQENHQVLLTAVAHLSVQQTRESLAVMFPRPDAPAVVRKLPTRRGTGRDAGDGGAVAERTPEGSTRSGRGRRCRAPIEPLSPARYKVQFTASAELKAKLDLARDLLRHAVPGGDLAEIVERALDLLLDDVEKRRFGSRRHRPVPKAPKSDQPSRAARRAVLERDGLRCTWVDERGNRCEARAWLELDHCEPRGKGGSSDPENLRLLCRGHNRLEAERAYGRGKIERARAAAAVARRKRATFSESRVSVAGSGGSATAAADSSAAAVQGEQLSLF